MPTYMFGRTYRIREVTHLLEIERLFGLAESIVEANRLPKFMLHGLKV